MSTSTDGSPTTPSGTPSGSSGSSNAWSGASGLWRLVLGLGVLAVVAGLVLHGGAEPTHRVAHLRPADPVRLEVASLHLDAPIVPIQVSADRVLDPPQDTQDVGWWNASARPGRESGQTVIAGHTVHTGGGAMDRLPQVQRGAAVDVVTGTGTMRYRVSSVRILSHQALAGRAERVFGQSSGSGGLVLVSCTDWNGSYYESNVVVTARRVGPVRHQGTTKA